MPGYGASIARMYPAIDADRQWSVFRPEANRIKSISKRTKTTSKRGSQSDCFICTRICLCVFIYTHIEGLDQRDTKTGPSKVGQTVQV